MLVNAHLQEPLCRTKKFDVKAVFDGIFKLFFNGIIAASIQHIVNKEKEAEPLVVFVISDKVGWFRWRLEKTLG